MSRFRLLFVIGAILSTVPFLSPLSFGQEATSTGKPVLKVAANPPASGATGEASAEPAASVDSTAAIQALILDETISVVRIDGSKVDAEGLTQGMTETIASLPIDAEDKAGYQIAFPAVIGMAKAFWQKFDEGGIKEIYFITDQEGATFMAVPMAGLTDEWKQKIVSSLAAPGTTPFERFGFLVTAKGISEDKIKARFAQASTKERPEIIGGLTATKGAAVGSAFVKPDGLFKALNIPAEYVGDLVEKMKWSAVGLSLLNPPKIAFLVRMADPEAAKDMGATIELVLEGKSLHEIFSMTDVLPSEEDKENLEAYSKWFLENAKPQIKGNEVAMVVDIFALLKKSAEINPQQFHVKPNASAPKPAEKIAPEDDIFEEN